MTKEELFKDLPIEYKNTDIYAFEVISGKWRLPIIWTLSSCESMRYNELKRRLRGITNIMLTRSLRGLETYNLVERNAYDELSPHVEYSLTNRAKELLPALAYIKEWAFDIKQTDDTLTGDINIGKRIAEYAESKVGNTYTWGGNGPDSFDCSGLVNWSYNQAGIELARTTASGYAKLGIPITKEEVQAGDIITFFGRGHVCHIGILTNDNTIIHAHGQVNEVNGQWGGNVRINTVEQIDLSVYNYRRIY